MRSEDSAAAHAGRLIKTQGNVHAHTLAIEALDDRLRRLNGRVNAELHRRRGPTTDEFDEPATPRQPALNGLGDDFELDPEVAAELALQRAPNARPGG